MTPACMIPLLAICCSVNVYGSMSSWHCQAVGANASYTLLYSLQTLISHPSMLHFLSCGAIRIGMNKMGKSEACSDYLDKTFEKWTSSLSLEQHGLDQVDLGVLGALPVNVRV